MNTVLLHIEDDGTITTPYGPVGDLEPCVLMSQRVIDATRQAAQRICPFARRLLQDGHGITEGNVMTIHANQRTLRYELHEARFDDDINLASPIYLGVLQC